jgi:hypothetical protein
MTASFEEQLWVLLIQAGCPVHVRVDARSLLRAAVEEKRERWIKYCRERGTPSNGDTAYHKAWREAATAIAASTPEGQ